MSWSLDFEDQQRLVTAFMQIEDMRRRKSRDLYISLLEDHLGHRLPLIRHEQNLHDVWQLVNTCLAHSGAIHTLVTILGSFHGGSRPMTALRELVAELLPEPLLTPTERRELRQLAAALENGRPDTVLVAALPTLYQQAVGPLGPVLGRDAHALPDVIAQLEDVAVGVDGVPPLLVFAGDLARRADGATAAALWDWVRRFAERLGMGQAQLDRLRQEALPAKRPDSDAARLVVECQPDAAEDDRYLITAWLQIGHAPGITLLRDDSPHPLTRLPLLLQALLTDHPTVVNRNDPELTIEFVVPRALLGYPFDQIKINVDGLERRLGIDHPVVMRSLDRLRRQALHHNWRRKWSWLQDNPSGAEVCWIGRPGEFDQERLYTLLSEQSSAVLMMAFPPWGGDPGPVDELWVGLLAGTPIIAWCRHDDDPARFSAEAGGLLETDLLSLPRKVHRLRRQAVLAESTGPGGDHLGLNLALIFDDADRVPEPYLRLKPPA